MEALLKKGPKLEKALESKGILIVDDEPLIQNLIGQYLDKIDFDDKKTVFADNGADAIRKMKNQEFGLVIVDIVMPKMDGLQLIKELRTNPKTRKIPVLLVSGNLSTETVKHAMLMGIRDIVAKPFNFDLFIERLFKTVRLPC